jgi:hypothetical protein
MTTIVVACVFSAGWMGGIAWCLGSWSGRGRRFCKRGAFDLLSCDRPQIEDEDERTSTNWGTGESGGSHHTAEEGGSPGFTVLPRIENDNEHEHDWGMGGSWGAHYTAGERGKPRFGRSLTLPQIEHDNENEDEHDLKRLVGEGTVEPVERETVSRAVGGARINFFVSSYNRIFPVHFADPAPQITDQLIERFVFRFSRQVPIEIPDQADADGDIVKIIAVNVSAVQLPDPAVADLDLTVP